MVAERDSVSTRWDKPGCQPLKSARRCYGHMAAELGVAQFEMLIRCGYLKSSDSGALGLDLSDAGSMWLAKLGVTLPSKNPNRMAYRCMDWSERKDHLAGTLSKALLDHYIEQRWLTKQTDSRALTVTPQGQRVLLPLLHAAAH